jgi:hypothetical protein
VPIVSGGSSCTAIYFNLGFKKVPETAMSREKKYEQASQSMSCLRVENMKLLESKKVLQGK